MPQCCPADLLQRVVRVAEQHAREVRAALGNQPIGIGSAAGYLEIVQRSPGRWDVPVSPEQFGVVHRSLPWWPLVEAVLGEGAEHAFSGVVFSDPATPAQCWHTDSPHESTHHQPPHALNVMVALHDIPMHMGPTELARGSHRLTNHLRNPALIREQLIYQHPGTCPEWLVEGTSQAVPEPWTGALAAGSSVIFDDRIMHRGLANRSDCVRRMAYFAYRRAGYAENTHFESARSVFDEASER